MQKGKKILKISAGVVGAGVVALAVVLAIPIEPTVPPLEPRPDTRYWSMEDGYRIAYTHVPSEGERERGPVIFLHGGPGGYVVPSAVETVGRLAALGRDVYLYDQVGSGLSDRLPKPKDYSFLEHVRDLHEIVTEKIEAERVVLIGQSYGGRLASYFVAEHPERVAKAVLTSPGGLQPPRFDEEGDWLNPKLYPVPDSLDFVEPPDVSEEMKVSSWPLRAIATVALATTFNVKLMPDEEADGVLNTIVNRIKPGMVCDRSDVPGERLNGMGMYSHGWSNWFGGVDDWRSGLRRADVPVLVLQGQCDIMSYARTYEYAALLPRGEYRFIERAGHVIWWSRPDRFVEEIRRFLTSHSET